MTALRFFTDEDIFSAIAPALRNSGFDAVSTPETGRLGLSDEDQLEWSAQEGRILVTFNVAHFAKLHADWLDRGLHHAGIVVSAQRPVGDLLQRLLHLAQTLNSDVMQDRIEFLSQW